jgi:hypothetical protein
MLANIHAVIHTLDTLPVVESSRIVDAEGGMPARRTAWQRLRADDDLTRRQGWHVVSHGSTHRARRKRRKGNQQVYRLPFRRLAMALDSDDRKRARSRRRSRAMMFGLMAMVALGGCASTGSSPTPPPDDNVDLAREIEEADIVKVIDGFFYLANPYKGLMIIDGRDMDHPTLTGLLPLGGRGVELFVLDDLAYIFTAADFYTCAGEPVGYDSLSDEGIHQPDYTGSRLWVVDLADKTAPQLASQFDFDGFVEATRRVGDAIYATGNSTIDLSDLEAHGVFVTSFNIADPDNITEADTVKFASFVTDIHVSADAIYVYGPDQSVPGTTLISYVDISDPTGDLMVRDQFRVPGTPVSRFALDQDGSALRVVTERIDATRWVRIVTLYVYDVSTPDDIGRLSDLDIVRGESLEAVRFDGDRGYAVTFYQVDPLYVLDLSDPADPQVAGELEVPGWSTHIVPLGDRLVAVGFDDQRGFRPAVALYDVSDPESPRRLSSVAVGDRWSYDAESEATVDEKALRVLEEDGLILLPFSTYDWTNYEYTEALQIIGLHEDFLSERGVVEHIGRVRRASVQDGRLWVLSDLAFKTADISDLDAPESLATVELIDEQELLDAGLSNCVDSLRYWGTSPFDWWWWGGSGALLCGAGALPFMALMLAGLTAMRYRRRRRR